MKSKQLFLLHFAGGNKYSFEFLKKHQADFEMISIELPGRGQRIKEELLISYQDAVRDMYKQIKEQLNGEEFVIYGHSLGATLSLGVVDLLEKENIRPKHLVVSGNAGPKIVKEKNRSKLPKVDFIAMLKDLGGLPEEVLQNEELLDFVLPILRSDFQIVESDNLLIDVNINTPITVIMGDQEKYVSHINNWQNYTKSNCESYVLKGNHFFIHNHSRRIIEIIKETFSKSFDPISV